MKHKEVPHPMLHGHHEHHVDSGHSKKGMKEPMGHHSDHHHSEAMKHLKALHKMAKHGHKHSKGK